jgi:ERCC4-type nuclease
MENTPKSRKIRQKKIKETKETKESTEEIKESKEEIKESKEETKDEQKEESYKKDSKKDSKKDIKLIIDDRERAISIHKAEWNDIKYEITRITTADYIVVNETNETVLAVIERKSLEDFAASIKDGRSENIAKLCEFREKTSCRILYLIEGDMSPKQEKEYCHIPYKTIESAIFHLIIRDNICVLRTIDTLDTAKTLMRFVRSMATLNGEMNQHTGGFDDVKCDETLLKEMMSQKHVKSDLDIVRELWSAFNGISIAGADEYIKAWSLADIIGGKVSRESILQHRLSSGRQINKKVASMLMALDKSVETRILSNIPMISRVSANYILLRLSLRELISLSEAELAQIAISDKKKLGMKLAKNIIIYMNYKGL